MEKRLKSLMALIAEMKAEIKTGQEKIKTEMRHYGHADLEQMQQSKIKSWRRGQAKAFNTSGHSSYSSGIRSCQGSFSGMSRYEQLQKKEKLVTDCNICQNN